MGNGGSLLLQTDRKEERKQMFEQMEDNLLGKANYNPGSFEDLHQKALRVFPRPFAGLRMAFANKFCKHSQLFSALTTGDKNSLNFDYRWCGSHNEANILNPYFFEIPSETNISPSSTDIGCSHGSIMRSLVHFRGRLTGDALEYLPTCLAMNVKSFLAEFAGDNFTVGFMARDVLLGDRLAIDDAFPGALDSRKLTECELQTLVKVARGLDIGFQLRKFIDEEAQESLEGPLWGMGIGARLHLFSGLLVTSTLSRGVFSSYIRARLSPDFQVALGYVHDSMNLNASHSRVACKFADATNGLVVKLSADTSGTAVASIAKELSSQALPLTLILVGACETRSPAPRYKVGLGLEIA